MAGETNPTKLCKICGERPRRLGRSYCGQCQREKYGRRAMSMRSPEARQKRIDENHDHYCRQKYGITLEEAKVVRARDCEVCGKQGPNCVDHTTDGSFHGTLCRGCNINLERFWPSHHLFLPAKAYWERTRPDIPFRSPLDPLRGRARQESTKKAVVRSTTASENGPAGSA